MRLAFSSLMILAVACTEPEPDPPRHTDEYCYIATTELSCMAGVARINAYWRGGSTSATLCRRDPIMSEATCSNGCAVEGTMTLRGSFGNFPRFYRAPASILCADEPSRAIDDACDFVTDPCLPTHPVMNADGTVAGHTYLDCAIFTHLCAPIEPPVVPLYMQRCAEQVETQYGGAGIDAALVTNAVTNEACILTWDETTQTVKSGITTVCMGDWQCPLYSLCDTEVPLVGSGGAATLSVCKRGPRGTLTPEILVP